MAARYPIYAEADMAVDSVEGPPESVVETVIAALAQCPAVAQAQS